MIDFFSKYPYMALSLTLLTVFGFALSISPSHCRKSILLSAVISAPYGFASALFVPEYWTPVRVFEFVAGPEDILFSFANGGMVWMAGIWMVRDRIQLKIDSKKVVIHVLGYVSFGYSSYVVFRFMDLGVMASVIASIGVLGAIVLAVRREFWPLALIGSVSFGVFYLIIIKGWFELFPGFIAQWTHTNLWGPLVFGVPVDEIVWAAGFGGVWPMIMAWAFDVRFVSNKASERPA